MKKFVYLFFVLLLLNACTQKIIVQDEEGIELPTEVVVMRNPELGIEVQALFLRIVEVSPESFYPQYLNSFDLNRFSYSDFKKTKEVFLWLNVLNPQKRYFKLWKRLKYGKKGDFEDKLLYQGNASKKHFQISIPKKLDITYQLMAMLQYKDGFPMLYIGYFGIKFNKQFKVSS